MSVAPTDCNRPQVSWNFVCPSCFKDASTRTDDPRGRTDVTPCPQCKWEGSCPEDEGWFFSGNCCAAEVKIAGETRYFCIPQFKCSMCGFQLWGRLRVYARCLSCKTKFDFALAPTAVCVTEQNLLKPGATLIRNWQDLLSIIAEVEAVK